MTFLTQDIARLAAFYERVFDATKTVDMSEEGIRHIFLQVDPKTVLHPFQILQGPALRPAPGAMFQHRRLDHFAFLAASREAFCELRRRIESEAAADGDVRDMNTMWIMGFRDPDGFYVEVIWRKPRLPDPETLPRADWTTATSDRTGRCDVVVASCFQSNGPGFPQRRRLLHSLPLERLRRHVSLT